MTEYVLLSAAAAALMVAGVAVHTKVLKRKMRKYVLRYEKIRHHFED